jgi:hypothetical protein
MRNTPTLTEIVRDAALNNDFGIDRALVLVKRLNHVYGKDAATRRALAELVDILISVRDQARIIHQTAEQKYQAERDAEEQIAQML